MKVYTPRTKDAFEKYYDLRWRILRKPWNQPIGSEKDELEDESIHIAVSEGGRTIGVGRLHFNSPEGGQKVAGRLQAKEAQIRYMAVDEGFRGKGVGSLLLKELERRARKKGAMHIVLNTRESAVGFYRNHGYRVVGRSHTLFGAIPHKRMRKDF